MLNRSRQGFTIVELLIVIVVIGILAAITLVAYSGIQNQAKEVGAKSASDQGYGKIMTYSVLNDEFPTDLATAGLSNNDHLTYEYTVDNNASPKTFCLTATFYNVSYYVSSTVNIPTSGVCSGHSGGGSTVVWTQVDAGENHTLALASDGKVYAWGGNWCGQLGDGSTTDRTTPVAIDVSGVLAGKTITQVSAGGEFSLALDSTGKVYSWGCDYSGQLGYGGEGTSASPVEVDQTGVLAGKTVTQIGAGYEHAAVLTSDGRVYSWGNNSGSLGDGTTTTRYVPVAVVTSGVLAGKTVTQLGVGWQSNIVLTSDGRVYSWGQNPYGQVGDGSTTARTSPVAVSTAGVLAGKTVTRISMQGSLHALVQTSDNGLYGWGRNNCGQVGDNSTSNRTSPVAVTTSGALAGKTLTSLWALNCYSFAASSDNHTYGWGGNYDGELDDGTTDNALTPTSVLTSGGVAGKTITHVSGDSGFTAFVTSSGELYTLGGNWSGQLGNGTTTNSSTPVAISIP